MLALTRYPVDGEYLKANGFARLAWTLSDALYLMGSAKKKFDLEHGLTLFDDWKADPDRSQRLDDWIWDNIGEVFRALNDVKTLRRFANDCKHYDEEHRYTCKSCGHSITPFCHFCNF